MCSDSREEVLAVRANGKKRAAAAIASDVAASQLAPDPARSKERVTIVSGCAGSSSSSNSQIIGQVATNLRSTCRFLAPFLKTEFGLVFNQALNSHVEAARKLSIS